VCPTTVRRYTNRGVLKHYRTPGNQRRFKLSEVLVFMETGSRRAADAHGPRLSRSFTLPERAAPFCSPPFNSFDSASLSLCSGPPLMREPLLALRPAGIRSLFVPMRPGAPRAYGHVVPITATNGSMSAKVTRVSPLQSALSHGHPGWC